MQQGPGQIKHVATDEAVAAEMVDAGNKGQATAGAERRMEKIQPGGAMRAEQRRPGTSQPLAAPKALRRKQQILERLNQRQCLYPGPGQFTSYLR
jgi:hypothetical protein